MNYMIIGARGYLGAYLIDELTKAGHDVIATDLKVEDCEEAENLHWMPFDVTDADAVDRICKVLSSKPKWRIFYLAACHHPDVVQKNPRFAWNINITALANFLNRMENVEAFFYPSTDTVYGEGSQDKLFVETDPTNPVNTYGKHKALAEQIVIAAGWNVVRFPFLIGPSLCPDKKHFYDVIYDTMARGEKMEMFEDSYRSAITFRQAAQYMIALCDKVEDSAPQLVNVCSDDALSKYDVGILIARHEGLNPDLVVPISIQHSEGIFEAKRASTALMDNSRLKKIMGVDEIHLHFEQEAKIF